VTAEVFESAQLPPGQMRSVVVAGRRVVVLRTEEGDLYALADRCPHRGARLSGGRLEEAIESDGPGDFRPSGRYVITCPWHHFQFSVDTGTCAIDPRERVLGYVVTEQDGKILVHRGPAAHRSRSVVASATSDA
jgi:nitrite reductase/ring-hydroxylating ferredoxin subunit